MKELATVVAFHNGFDFFFAAYEWFQKSTMAERINDAHHGPAPVGKYTIF